MLLLLALAAPSAPANGTWWSWAWPWPRRLDSLRDDPEYQNTPYVAGFKDDGLRYQVETGEVENNYLTPLNKALDESEICQLTRLPPQRPKMLEFCYEYTNNACCLPGHDLQSKLDFRDLIDGLG